MAGLLEEILARAQYMPPGGMFPPVIPPVDQAAEAAAARELAGQRMLLANRKRPPNPLTQAPDAQSAGVQLAMENAPAGTGVPFSTQAGMLAPPPAVGAEDAPGPIPMPQPRPAEADLPPGTPSDASAARRSAPPPTNLVPPAPPAAPQAGMIEQSGAPSFFDNLRTSLGNNSNTLLALGAGLAGAPNIGQGISRAAAAAIPARAADLQQTLAAQSRSYGTKALVDAGVPIQQAIAAQADPELKKALIQQYIVDRKGELKETGVDRYGNKIFQIFDPYSKTLTPITNPGQDPSAAVTAENDVTGPDYLQKLKEQDPAYARQVEQIVNGDAAMPTGRQSQTPIGRKLRQDALTVEPGLSDSDFSTRQRAQIAYTSGDASRVTKSVNTTLKHAGTLEKAINNLNNFDVLPGALNRIRSTVAGQTSPEYQKARAAYDTAVANFAKELDFAVSGGRPTVSGTKHQMEGFGTNSSHAAQLEKLRTGVELLQGRLDSHAKGYAEGRRPSRSPMDFIYPENRDIYRRLSGDTSDPTGLSVPQVPSAPSPARPAAAASNEPIAVNRQTGERRVFRNGQWQPLQQ